MFGVEQIGAIGTYGMLVLASAGFNCEIPKPPEIEVIPVTSSTQYNYSLGLTEISNMQTDTVSPYDDGVDQHMLGLHEGVLKVSYEVSTLANTVKKLNSACVYFDKITVKIELEPVIYVAKELRQGSCEHNAVLDHENKHVMVDRGIANEYAMKIGSVIKEVIDEIGGIGPYQIKDVQKIRAYMNKKVGQAITSYKNELVAEQAIRQQNIDTLEEYERVSDQIRNKCKFDIDKAIRSALRSRR